MVFSFFLCTFAKEISNGTEDNLKQITIMKKYRFYLSAYVDINAESKEDAIDKFYDAQSKKTLDIKQVQCYDEIEEDPDNVGEV